MAILVCNSHEPVGRNRKLYLHRGSHIFKRKCGPEILA